MCGCWLGLVEFPSAYFASLAHGHNLPSYSVSSCLEYELAGSGSGHEFPSFAAALPAGEFGALSGPAGATAKTVCAIEEVEEGHDIGDDDDEVGVMWTERRWLAKGYIDVAV